MTRRWEGVAQGALWASHTAANADVQWVYNDPQSTANDLMLNDYVVTEWRSPRCEGNFVRRHYDGFGQLTQEQRPDAGWRLNYEGCTGEVAPLPEVDIDYAYDGLGRQVAASVPHTTTVFWANRPAQWSGGYTATQYDALG